jgi:phospholipid-binding lipoprotein MlaA
MDEALDKYSFIRDAYLQHRTYQITGVNQEDGGLYVDEGTSEATDKAARTIEAQTDYVDE